MSAAYEILKQIRRAPDDDSELFGGVLGYLDPPEIAAIDAALAEHHPKCSSQDGTWCDCCDLPRQIPPPSNPEQRGGKAP